MTNESDRFVASKNRELASASGQELQRSVNERFGVFPTGLDGHSVFLRGNYFELFVAISISARFESATIRSSSFSNCSFSVSVCANRNSAEVRRN